jgi:hypothetical protein
MTQLWVITRKRYRYCSLLQRKMSVERCPSIDVRREGCSFGSGGRHNRSYRREKLSALQLYMDMVGRRFGSNTLAFRYSTSTTMLHRLDL